MPLLGTAAFLEADPGLGLPDHATELIRRARHTGVAHTNNNRTVWSFIRAIFFDTDAYPYIRRYERARNGRAAYFAIKGHYLGTTFTVTIRANAESIIANARFTGQSRNFTLERFLSQLQGAWNDLPEEEVSDERKLSVLMRALQAPELAATKQTILATPALRGDYDAAVNLLTENHIRVRENARGAARGVGATETTGGRNGGRGNQFRDARRMRGGGRPNGGRHGGRGGGRFGGRGGRGGRGGGRGGRYNPRNPGRYLSTEEWRNLTPEQRAQVRAARDQTQQANSQVAAYAAQVGIAAYAQGQAAAGQGAAQGDNNPPNVQFQIAATQQQPQQPAGIVLPPPPANLMPPRGAGIGATMSRRNYGRRN